MDFKLNLYIANHEADLTKVGFVISVMMEGKTINQYEN